MSPETRSETGFGMRRAKPGFFTDAADYLHCPTTDTGLETGGID
jgi:hypothetical protein